MLGIRKKPVFFKIHKPVMGIGRSRYANGVLETRDNREIAILRRLSENHAEELPDGLLVEKVPETPEVSENVQEVPEVVIDETLAGLPWMTVRDRLRELLPGVYKVGMKRTECEALLSEAMATVEKTPI